MPAPDFNSTERLPLLAARSRKAGDDQLSGRRPPPSLGWTVAINQITALEGGANPFFLDGEQDAGDEPEIVHDGETISWENDPQSQDVLVSL